MHNAPIIESNAPYGTGLTPAPTGHEWVILHTRPRAEKKAVQAFEREGFAMYLPLRRKEHRYGNRRRAFWSPLFAGYVFGCFPSKNLSKAKSNHYVANVLRVVDQDGLVRQLQHIQQATEAGDMVELCPYLEKGRLVRITSGPLAGVEGMVESIAKRTKVVISIEMIQQSVYVEVDSTSVELL